MADIQDKTTDVSIHNESTDAAVTTTTDGAKERLDVQTQDITVTATVDFSDFEQTQGGQKYLFIKDIETNNLLRSILKQLKIMNMHLSMISDEQPIRKEDIE
jgi:hypothetical protein